MSDNCFAGRFQPIYRLLPDERNEIAAYELLAGPVVCPDFTANQWFGWYADIADRLPGKLPGIQGDVFVNVHSWQMLDPLIFDQLMRLAPVADRLVLEWTELSGYLGQTSSALMLAINGLRDAGFRFAIDDVGGHGIDALWRVLNSTPAFVKIDGAYFHSAIERGELGLRALYSLIESFLHQGIEVVVEWVESADQVTTVRRLGAQYAQGHFFAGSEVDYR